MVTIDELKQDFAVVNVAPYGKCLIIPARMFGAAWENDLKQQGCKIFSGSSEGQAAFFVKLPNTESKDEADGSPKLVYDPSKARGTHLGRFWTEEEDKRLIELAKQNQKHSLKEITKKIAKQMPGRNENSVKMRIQRLREKGLLPFLPIRRYKQGDKPHTPLKPLSPPSTVNDKDKRVKELLEASAQLYPTYRHASAVLLREAAKEMEREA